MKNFIDLKLIYVIFAGLIVANIEAAIDAKVLVEHVEKCIDAALAEKSKLPNEIVRMTGMSSPKVRHFLNNVCSLQEGSYFEIGVWKGSTLISALYENSSTLSNAIALDNWSQFNDTRWTNLGIKQDFKVSTSKYLLTDPFKFFEYDSFNNDLNFGLTHPINIYFYSGEHSFESQKKAFTYYNDLFDENFIAIVDNWNLDEVSAGTKQAFADLGYTIVFEKALPSNCNADLNNWWNGLYVAVISKGL